MSGATGPIAKHRRNPTAHGGGFGSSEPIATGSGVTHRHNTVVLWVGTGLQCTPLYVGEQPVSRVVYLSDPTGVRS